MDKIKIFYDGIDIKNDTLIKGYTTNPSILKKYNKSYSELIPPLLDKLKAAAIIKIKANLNTKTQEIIEHGYHVDHPYSSGKTSILYLNTCNGYTAFEDGTIVNSIKNRIVI